MDGNLRWLRMFLAVIEYGSAHRAAEKLHLTQSSFTKAVQNLEREAGVLLFERTRRGMTPTAFGVALATRARRAIAYLNGAERELRAVQAQLEGAVCRGFGSRLTRRQLSALVAIADHKTERSAALVLSVSQPVVAQALRDLEHLVGVPMFLRTAREMAPTPWGEILAQRAKLAFSEIAAADADIASLLGQVTGRVVVGALPLSGQLVPSAINCLLGDHPGLHVSVVDGTFTSLIRGVMCGDVDVIIGALEHPTPPYDIAKESLLEDRMVIVARRHHPLARKRHLSFNDLRGVQWVVPRVRTPARMYLDRIALAAGLDLGQSPIESNSFLTSRALLLDSDRLAIVACRQIDIDAGLLAILPLELPETTVPIGVGTRADGLQPAGVQAFLRCLRQVARESLNLLNYPRHASH